MGNSPQILVARKGTPRSPWIREQESRKCRRCGAEPGHQCVTAAGTFAMRPHMERYRDAGGSAEGEVRRVREIKQAGKRQAEARAAARRQVFAHYGTSCACCGTLEELTIDHINGNGDRHREQIGTSSSREFYRWLIKNGFPSGFQTLCMPCNASKFDGEHCRMHHNVCPACRRPYDDGSTVTVKPWARRRKTA